MDFLSALALLAFRSVHRLEDAADALGVDRITARRAEVAAMDALLGRDRDTVTMRVALARLRHPSSGLRVG